MNPPTAKSLDYDILLKVSYPIVIEIPAQTIVIG